MNNFITDLGNSIVPWYIILAAAICTYFLGNINPAIIIGRAKGVDIRQQGSGNAGATNALRSLGGKAGALTFIIDVAKGWIGFYFLIAVWGVAAFAPAMLCGLCVVLGHMYPVIFGFRGGKGVSTVFGVLLAASWLYALILLAIVIVLTLIFRRVSLSVMIAVIAALVIVFWNGAGLTDIDPLWTVILLALVVWKHRSNISRLIKGQEPKLSFGKNKGK